MADKNFNQFNQINPQRGDMIPYWKTSLNGAARADLALFLTGATRFFAPVGFQGYADAYTTGVNDNVAIQALLDQVGNLGGGRVFGYEGRYFISSRLKIPDNVEFFGVWMKTIFQKSAGISNSRVLTNYDDVNGNTNIYMHDFIVDGNHEVGDTGITSNLAHVTSSLVERVKILNGMQGFKTDTCTDVTFRDCIADGNYNWNFYQFNGTRIKVHHSRSLNSKADVNEGFGMAFYANGDSNEAIGNYIFNSAHNGLQINAGTGSADVPGMIARDNRIQNAGNRGIFVTDDGNTFHIKKLSVINNRVWGSVSAGIYFIDAYDTDFWGNKSWNNTGDGIIFENVVNMLSQGNLSTGNNGVGMRVVGSGASIKSIGDMIYGQTNNYSPGIAATGIKIRNNDTFVTQNSGTGTINSGSTSVTVNHGLAVTPAASDINVTLLASPTNDPGSIWISNITSTQFTINCRNNPGTSGASLAWRAAVI